MPVLENLKHEVFAHQIAAGKTGTEAAIVAGYSEKSARFLGSKLSTKPNISARIAEINSEIVQASTWDAAKVLRRLGEIVDADIAEIYDDKHRLKPLSEWPKYWRQSILRIKTREEYERSQDGGDSSWDPAAQLLEIHAVDRLKALELLGKHKAVDAFVQQKQEQHVHLHLHGQIEERLARAREVAAQLPAGEQTLIKGDVA